MSLDGCTDSLQILNLFIVSYLIHVRFSFRKYFEISGYLCHLMLREKITFGSHSVTKIFRSLFCQIEFPNQIFENLSCIAALV